ncbi:MAG TPA: oxidoreductase, partial [Alcanivorax sp.]|nr:oxidoreductase [Alcanivorax sp.]
RRGHGDAEPLLWRLGLLALIGARVAFVARYHDRFAGPLEMIDLRDGGLWWPGAVVGAGLALAWALRDRAGRDEDAPLSESWRALLTGAVAAVLTASVTLAVSSTAQPAPEVTLHRLDGTPVTLSALSEDRLTLVNLWASWCPPCRREMPVLEQGQSDYPAVRFVYANQGESAEIIRGYLLEEGLRLDNVVLDPHSDLARALGGSGLPTTVLIGRDGTLVNSHVGPLSRASLHHFINPHLQE